MAAAATPVFPGFTPDAERLAQHCRWLLQNGCDGVTLLGTTGAFASFSVEQRLRLMQAVEGAGLPLEAMLVGTGATAFEDAVTLTSAATALGFGGALVVPPFYFKAPSDDGLFAFFAHLIERVADPRLRLYLYHFPKMSGVPFTRSLVVRLLRAFPKTIAGLKDSSEGAELARALHDEYPEIDVFPGSEAALLNARRAGYAGCISATVNVTAPLAGRIWNGTDDANLAMVQAWLSQVRDAIASVPLVPAVHALLGELHCDPGWMHVPPPLCQLSAEERTLLAHHLADAQYGVELSRA
jgi:4-hydroxy-tetrahydrodipicolinate synthase